MIYIRKKALRKKLIPRFSNPVKIDLRKPGFLQETG